MGPRPIDVWLAGMFMACYSVNMDRHKHLVLDQSKIDRARKILGVKTEQETVTQALDLVIAEAPILRVHRKLKGVGGFEDVFR
jgi:hypothetical protein